jgi:hypothetical protein
MPLSTKQFTNLIGGHGFEGFEQDALDVFNQNIGSLVKGGSTLPSPQQGGRVSMPADYFGTPTKAWTATMEGTNPSMATPTDTVVRPELASTFQLGGGIDGAKIFNEALKDFKLSGGASSSSSKKRMSKEEKEAKKHYFRNAIEKLFAEVRKVATKTKILKAVQLKRAFKKI